MTDVKTLQAAIESEDNEYIAQCFTALGWPPAFVSWNLPAAAQEHRELIFGWDYWSGLRCGAALPDHRRIDPVELRPMLGYVALLEVLDQGEDFLLRLYGSRIADLSGFEASGKRLSEMPTDPLLIAFMTAGHRAVLRRRAPLFSVHPAPAESNATRWSRLVLPFVDENDAIVRNMAVNHPGEWREPSQERRPRLYETFID